MADRLLPSLELKLRPDAHLVGIVRRFVSELYDQFLRDVDATSRVALATHELLENAVLHAADGEATIRICVESDDGGADRLVIRTWNHATEANVQAVRRLFAEMSAESDAHAYYQTVMRRSVKRTSGSGLGLARVRAEAEMELGLEVSGLQVTIVATTSVSVRQTIPDGGQASACPRPIGR